jgi:hypothetical protein
MLSEDQIPDAERRGCGHTGPITPEGRAISARNATRHGMCATTLILQHENEQDWLQLLHTWLALQPSGARLTRRIERQAAAQCVARVY